MPKVDLDMSHGRILAWRVKEGQTVEEGEPLFDIETDKAAMEVESPASGTVRDLVEENVDVAIGEAVAFIYADGESIPAPAEAPSPGTIEAQPDPSLATDQPLGSITETDVTIPSGGQAGMVLRWMKSPWQAAGVPGRTQNCPRQRHRTSRYQRVRTKRPDPARGCRVVDRRQHRLPGSFP